MAVPVVYRSLGFTVTADVWNGDLVDSINSSIQSGVFGAQVISSGGTGGNQLQIRNTTNGTTNFSQLALGNDAITGAAVIAATSTSYTPASNVPQDGMYIASHRTGGITISAQHAGGVV